MSCDFPMAEWTYDDAEPVGVWQEEKRVAKKRHRCCECGGWVEPGERYETAACCADGGWQHWHRCAECALLVEMAATMLKECPAWGWLAEWLDEHRGWKLPADFPRPGEGR